MRKYIKEQILDLISSMQEMHEEIQKLIEAEDLDTVQNYISICYDGAIQIDSVLEGSEDKCVNAISAIENYAEELNRIFENLSSPDERKKAYSLIKEKLSVVEHYVIKEIKVKYQILFLPYKASMWDSLESIWLAAKEDANCECYVMPIPYYDFKQNGEISKMRLEADQMPSYVPITQFNEYDIAQQMPDIIYFHNPYDKFNKVTSVDPKYYSSELKKHTNMLVYVPYFVGDTTIEEHFCELPGVYNADYVIVQSEQIKEIYAKYIRKDKILALGSPKFDKVISCMKNKPEVPEEWQEIIQDKKVILLNTHLMMVPQYREKAIEKLQYIFNAFKDRDDAVLLWRPHPLSEETTQAMSLSLIDQYNELVAYYNENNIGIYDESADVHRAIAISDAYYGSPSSIHIMFGLTGKPVMLMDMEVLGSTEADSFFAGYFDGTDLWYSDSSHNGLYKCNISDNTCQFVGNFPGEENGPFLHRNMIKYHNKLILPPFMGRALSIYDIENNEFKSYQFRNQLATKMMLQNPYKIAGIVPHKNWIYLIGCSLPIVIRFDMFNETFDYSIDLSREIQPFVTNMDDISFYKDIVVSDDSFMVASCNSNIVLEFNMETCQYKLHRVGDEDATYLSICYDNRNYWLCPRTKGKITRWNKETGETETIDEYPNNFVKTENDFVSMIFFDEKVWIFPYLSYNKYLRISVNEIEFKKIVLEIENPVNASSQPQFNCICNTDSHMMIQYAEGNKVIIFDKQTNDYTELLFEGPDNSGNNIVVDSLYMTTRFPIVIYEYNKFSIKEYVSNLMSHRLSQRKVQLKDSHSQICNVDGSCGRNCHKNIIKKLRNVYNAK